MDHIPVLSILTPVYNAECFIQGCLENVRDQNCTNIEHLVWDGGSTDSTTEIIHDFAAKHNYVKLICEKDRGQSDAMNQLIKMARAPWIGFLNADDYYEAGVLASICSRLNQHKEPSLIMGNCRMIRERDGTHAINSPEARTVRDLVAGKSFPYNASAYFYHKSIHDLIGPYDIYDNYTMDLDFLLRAFRVAHVGYYNEIWGNFRLIPGSKTYEDAQTGSMWKRCNDLRQKYFTVLSPIDQLWVHAFRASKWIAHKKQRIIECLS